MRPGGPGLPGVARSSDFGVVDPFSFRPNDVVQDTLEFQVFLPKE